MKSSLSIRAGSHAMKVIQRDGFSSNQVAAIAGAAGGPKWLVLSQMDRVLFGDWIKPRTSPLFLIGASIGAWRFSALAQNNPLKAIQKFEEAYLAQSYSSSNPSTEEVTRVSQWVMDEYLDSNGVSEIVNHPYFRTNVFTVKSKNVFKLESKAAMASGFALAMTGNALHPSLLNQFFERTIFSDPRNTPLFLSHDKFKNSKKDLLVANYKKAILASGSIPAVMQGVSDIPGHEGAVFRDGGILDYHLDIPYNGNSHTNDLVLFPHFSEKIVPNWFDKALPWRKPSKKNFENVITISPSQEFISKLPMGKITDRNDFNIFKGRDHERVKYWNSVLNECKKLGDELKTVLDKNKISEVVKPL